MASDIATITTTINQEDPRRKHRSSSDDDLEESSKRRKHRHHHHHHHRSRHHRHRSKKCKEETKNEDDESIFREGEDVNSLPTGVSTLPPVVSVSGVNLELDYDMEEGEIVEDAEEGFGVDQFEKKAYTEEVLPVVQNLNVHAEVEPLKDIDGESVRKTSPGNKSDYDCVTDTILNTKEKVYNLDDNNCKSKDMGKEYNTDTDAASHESALDKLHSRSRSRSHDAARNRSRSRSVVKEVAQLEHMYDNWDDTRKVRRRGEHSHGSNDLKEHNTSSSRYTDRLDGDHSLEVRDADRERRVMYRDGGRERERYRRTDDDKRMAREHVISGHRDKDQDRKAREKEQERSRDWVKQRESREMEKERARSRDRNVDRERFRDSDKDKRRESERDKSKDRMREGSRGNERDRNRDWIRDREKDGDRDRDWTRDREKDGKSDRNIDKDGGRGSNMESRYDEIDRHNRTSRNNLQQNHNSKADSLKEGEDKRKRDKEEQDDYQERISLQLEDQEEEDIDRIKEESRRIRQAILEKYKSRQVKQEVVVQSNNGVKEESPGHSFSVGKSPPLNEVSVPEQKSDLGRLGEGTPKSERSNDMFCDNIFGDSPAKVCKSAKGNDLAIENSGLNDNWDDAEGYYSYRFGENLDGRYEITAAHGKGVFSNVVRAKDVKAGNGEPDEVAIKIIRNNETMFKAGQTELIILKKLVGADPENKRHCVRFLSSFKYRNHLCLVFESLHMNLREVLKKFGRNIGLKLTAVRAYAKQLFIALKHLRNCGVLHCDIKPDNMLVNEAKNVLKLCDFGSAMFAGKNEITPYLVSRFYRAPEIILGLPYDHPMDIWSVGCCLYELYTGKVLFPGPSNNDMLRLHMELKGPFPKKMLRKGGFIDQHFDQDLNFLAMEEDPVTKKAIRRMINNIKPKDIGTIITSSPGEDPKMVANFKDLLDKIFMLDPEKRMTVSQALNHPFITDSVLGMIGVIMECLVRGLFTSVECFLFLLMSACAKRQPFSA